MWNSESGTSVAEMVAQTAKDHLVSTSLPGFVYEEAVGMYYSPDTGYYYDVNTNLYYHPVTQCYYQYDHELGKYKSYSTRNVHWNDKRCKKRATKVFGEEYLGTFDQDYIDCCEALFQIVDRLSHQRTFSAKNVYIAVDDVDIGLTSADDKLDSSSDEFDYDSETERRRIEDEMSKYPSCIRLVNTKTSDLAIITIDGGYVGSCSSCDIVVVDEIPERYMRVQFDEVKNVYQVFKLSTMYCLYINENVVSDRHTVSHLDRILIGPHQFVTHIHKGTNTCPDCEPGVMISKIKETRKIPTFKVSHKQEMRKLKSQFGLIGIPSLSKEPQFNDRAKQRRMVQGSEPPFTTKSSNIYANCKATPVNQPEVSEPPEAVMDGKGFKILKAMGWKEGSGLGKNEQGMAEPIRNTGNNSRRGLGSANPGRKSHIPIKERIKAELLEKTKRRYEQI